MSSGKAIYMPETLKSVAVAYFGPPPVNGNCLQSLQAASYDKGVEDANNRSNQQILDHRKEVEHLQQSVFKNLSTEFDKLVEEINRRLPELLLVMLRRVLADTPMDRKLVCKIIDETLGQFVSKDEDLEISLSKSDLALLRGGEGSSEDLYPGITLLEDPALQPGDCLVRSRFGLVDARVQTKISKIEKELRTK